ncbi:MULTISPECIES: hypothetical protein [Elizabethkingia]|uniref:hypothetical protein n=1 Tax=Elizabethkingia TaxID=308865 RepID=UPI0009996837|nr:MULTISPECIES: hypothetical protein [Elizabethkingia]AQX90577.1 hypothetical protein AYC67_16835 [Elizabethkingia anophelis]EHM7981719.1 hypothetical protein [Elizabethkingia anophelis]EHM8032217.1 hypothetical protein [Elizabethkingia anophelis]EHZ9535171.1 hypothetical protein [Elizabethkingia anophelis]EKU3673081.1 hypothetical protein [Elizabethkingia anophelis]
MDTNLHKHHYKKIFNVIFLITSFLITSCRSNENITDTEVNNNLNGNASVTPGIFNTASEDGNIEKTASIGKSGIGASEVIQKQTVKDEFGNLYDITLAPSRSSSIKNAQASLNPTAALGTPTALTNGVMYSVLVYDKATGNFVTSKNYTAGSAISPITGLNGGQTYTFIVYSVNSTTVPTPTNRTNLSTVALTNLTNNASNNNNSDLMYFTTDLTLASNSNTTLTGTMLHQFARLKLHINTSSLNSITATPGNITEVGGISVSPVGNSVTNFNFSTGQITYGTVNSGSTINFTNPQLSRIPITTTTGFPGSPQYDSKALVLLTPTTTNGQITISRVVTDGGMEYMGNIIINNARITEKTDYDLTITPNLSNIVSTGSYGPFYNSSTTGNSFNNAFSDVVAGGSNGNLASYSGIMLDGYINGAPYFTPMFKNISGTPIAYNLKCGTRFSYAGTTNFRNVSGTLAPNTKLQNLDPDNIVFISGYNNISSSDRNVTMSDQETCTGTITPQGLSAINVIFRWRTSGSGYTVNDNYLTTSIQLK